MYNFIEKFKELPLQSQIYFTLSTFLILFYILFNKYTLLGINDYILMALLLTYNGLQVHCMIVGDCQILAWFKTLGPIIMSIALLYVILMPTKFTVKLRTYLKKIKNK